MAADPKGGFFSEHAELPDPVAHVAPKTQSERNTLRVPPRPVACWRLEDFRFEFDSSFVKPDAKPEIALLSRWWKHLDSPALSVFGHADPTGDDEYNKVLAGRRAQAVYALLVRDTALWDDLYATPHGGDNWQNLASARAAKQQGFLHYMDSIAQDESGSPFKVEKTDFIGKNSDAKGKADYQGCSEFNPVLVFSKDEAQRFTQPANKPERDRQNATNRRVLVFMYPKGTTVDPTKWPCPRAKEGSSACRAQFWPDAETRRNPSDRRRDYVRDGNTFACSFYDQMARRSPCEAPRKLLQIRLFDGLERAMPRANYRLTIGSAEERTGKAESDGTVRENEVLAVRELKVEWAFEDDDSDRYPFSNVIRLDYEAGSDAQTSEKRLSNLGYLLDKKEDNAAAFRHDYEISDGADWEAELKKIHDNRWSKEEYKAQRGAG